jgi:hypothetical protein
MCHLDHSTGVHGRGTILGWDGQCVQTGIPSVDRLSVSWGTDGLQ